MSPFANAVHVAAASTQPWWLEEFRPFTWQHVLAAGGAIAIMLVMVLLGRRWRDDDPTRERRLRGGWVATVVLLAAFTITWWLLPRNFDIRISLPLHVCDLAVLLAIPALLTEIRWIRAVLYFWAIGLSTQAFFTPILTRGVAEVGFWIFWIGHLHIVGSAVYDVAVRRFRPTLADLGVATAISIAYISAMFLLNWAFDLNYGYVGPAIAEGTIITALGPWPQRVPIMVALGIAAMTIAWIPWGVARRLKDASRSPAEP